VALSLIGCGSTPRPTFPEPAGISELYRSVVIVRAGIGGGSGIVLEPDLVLTASHVVTAADVEDRVRWVDVLAPIATADGVIPSDVAVRAFVVARDTTHDLALLRLERPLDGVTPMELALDDPRVGDPVACVGHGRGRLLWSTRRGHVHAFASEAVRALRDRACIHGQTIACQEGRFGLRETSGDVIETSCGVSNGDSGGPLVDAQGRLVGVASYLEYAAHQHDVAYFVHPRAVRAFLARRPREPLAAFPEAPRLPQGGLALDFDQDGVWESLAQLADESHEAQTWMDLDGSSALVVDEHGELTPTSLATFDPELVLVESMEHGPHLFVDASGDGTFDTLVFLDRRSFAARGVFGRDGEGWTRDATRQARWSGRIGEDLVDEASRPRWERLLRQGGERPWEGPLPRALRRGQLEDLDRDGRADALIAVDRDVLYEVMWEITALDVDQTWPARAELDARLDAPRTGIDVVIFASPQNLYRVWFDRDGDGSFETVLDADADGLVTSAEVRGEGQSEPRDAWLGTLVGRWDFVPRGRERARALLTEALGRARVHDDAGIDLAVLPDDDALYFDPTAHPGVYRGHSDLGPLYAIDLEGDAIEEPPPSLLSDADALVVVGASSTRVVVDVDHDGRPELTNLRLVLPSGDARCWATLRVGARYERTERPCDALYDLSSLRSTRLTAPLQAKLRTFAAALEGSEL
jgi:hypothetical protein